jgi:lysophospholipase L1-like esterase
MKALLIFGSLLVMGSGGNSFADDGHREALVLGDSVPFGYIASVGYDYFYRRPENFVGFANDLGDWFHLETVNASCPGETTGSFLSSTAPDNGCRAYRELYPLHVHYHSTQLEFATDYLKQHHEVRLVAIMLGANDGLLLEASCASQPTPVLVEECIEAGAPALLATVETNMQKILTDLQATGYSGAIVINNYYSLDYSNAPATALTSDLNAAIAAPAQAFGAVVADNFSAFEAVASNPSFGGQTCKTGLLNPDVITPYACNIHPARTGHRVIAQSVAHALRDSEFQHD